MARTSILLGLLVTCAACTSSSGTAEGPKQPTAGATTAQQEPLGKAPKAEIALEEYFKTTRIGLGATFSHDEKHVAFVSDRGGRMDLWLAPVSGGDPKQITKVEGFLNNALFSPTQDVLAYQADVGGSELSHVFLTSSKGEAGKDLNAADPATSRAELVRWREDGKALIYLSSRRDEKFLDLYELDPKSGKSELLWTSADKLAFGITSRDAKKFIIIETLSDVNNNLYLLERKKDAKPVLITQHEGDVLYNPLAFAKDGKTLYLTSDQGSEYTALVALDLAAKTSKVALKEDWDVEDAMYSETYRYLVTNTNVDGLPKIAITDSKTKKPVELPGATENAALIPVAFSKSDRYVAAISLTDNAPRALVVIDLDQRGSFQPVEPLPASLREKPMASGKSVRVPSFDGKEVQAYLYAPEGAGPFPAVIDVHGGPTAQSRRDFNAMRQYLVSKGYAVLVPNVRGSTGYGKTWTKLDNLDLGGGPLKDIIACKQWMVKEAKVDAKKVAIMGGSYGGYMTLAAATFTPDEFAAHVDYFGVSDLKSLVESFPPYWAAFATFIYQKFGDPKNPEHAAYQHDRSPLNFADKIQKPLLVVQGSNDARVKKDQSDRLVEKLKARGVPVHYLVIEGEGHGFSKNENRLSAYALTDRFLDRYLFNDPSIEVMPPAPAAAAAPASSSSSN